MKDYQTLSKTQKIFSLPVNPKLTEQQFYNFLDFCKQHKEWIFDVYFTSRIPPFAQDAMGDVLVTQEDAISAIETALHIQQETGITACATFNNIEVPPTQQYLDIWLEAFQPLYNAGIRSVIIPHIHWMATGQIKNRYPDLYVKNTILRNVTTGAEFVAHAKAGFDYICVDRDLMRDRDALIRLKKAKQYVKETLGKDVTISLLANEGCLGACPMMDEHYQFNNTRDQNRPQYFADSISRVSCPKWDHEDPAVPLKTANLPPWKEDWVELLDYVDVFKMHGRESTQRLEETLNIVRKYIADEPILLDGFEEFIEDTNLVDKPINIWRDKIKNCKFECWECQYCDKIVSKKQQEKISPKVQQAVDAVITSAMDNIDIDVIGLTSWKMESLINKLASNSTRYLEIGSALGATACAALKNNKLEAICVDTWSETFQPANELFTMPENKKEDFITNVKRYKGENKVIVYESDMLMVNREEITDVDFLFYDGPHDIGSTIKALKYYAPCLSNEAFILVDDANWEGVVQGVDEAIRAMNVDVLYSKVVLNDQEDINAWWNGFYLLVVKKKLV
jgi:predicted O-methyltransferase YrrM